MALWLVTVGGGESRIRSYRLDDRPCPSVQAGGIAGVGQNQWWIEEADRDPLERMPEAEARATANRLSRECGR